MPPLVGNRFPRGLGYGATTLAPHFLFWAPEARGKGGEQKWFPCFLESNYSNACILSHWDNRLVCLKKQRKCWPSFITQWTGVRWRLVGSGDTREAAPGMTRGGLPPESVCTLSVVVNFQLRRGLRDSRPKCQRKAEVGRCPLRGILFLSFSKTIVPFKRVLELTCSLPLRGHRWYLPWVRMPQKIHGRQLLPRRHRPWWDRKCCLQTRPRSSTR